MQGGMGTQVSKTITVFAVSTKDLELNAVYNIAGLRLGSFDPVDYPKATFSKAIAPAIAEFTIP